MDYFRIVAYIGVVTPSFVFAVLFMLLLVTMANSPSFRTYKRWIRRSTDYRDDRGG